MRALFVEAAGDEPKLAVRQVPVPELGAEDVLVRVAACGFCHHDAAVMAGTLRRGVKPGVVLGHEISGQVAHAGSAVKAMRQGDRVVSALVTFCGECQRCLSGREYRCLRARGVGHAIDGGFAEYVRLPESSLVPIPDEVDLVQACLLACPIAVALQAVRDVGQLVPGETALVTGAGGGLGVHAVQVASVLGARVMAVTTSPEKVGLLEALGAPEVILADEMDLSEVALALTEDMGVDVVIDTVGSATIRSSVRSLGQFGRIVLMGEVTGERASLSLAEVLFRDATIRGSTGASRRHIADAVSLVAAGRVKPVVSHSFALEDAGEAFRLVRSRRAFGRVVLIP